MLPTPDTSHLRHYPDVYEPAEDTFLFLDALQLEREYLAANRPLICAEIGPGSGCIITFLGLLMRDIGHDVILLASDINPAATRATQETAARNGVAVHVVRADLVSAFEHRLHGKIDVILCNPPYVPSELGAEEDDDTSDTSTTTSATTPFGCGLAAAWDGGALGREMIDRMLPHIAEALSDTGTFYLLLEERNLPAQVIRTMAQLGLGDHRLIKARKAFNEKLSIHRFRRGAARSKTKTKTKSRTQSPSTSTSAATNE